VAARADKRESVHQCAPRPQVTRHASVIRGQGEALLRAPVHLGVFAEPVYQRVAAILRDDIMSVRIEPRHPAGA